MIRNVIREGVDKDNNVLKSNDKSCSLEIQKIKELLNVADLEYMSDILKRVLDITQENRFNIFDGITNDYRVIEKGDFFRVILYIRLSVEDGDIIDGDVSKSIRNQLLYLLTECNNRKWKVVAIFAEEGISGADDNRPEWLKALKYCECGNTEIFLCKSQSRFSRSMEMIEKYLHKEFVSWNVRFVGLVDSTDTAVQGNKKTRQINGLVNEWMVEDQSINTRKILRNKKMNGLFTGSFAPYGYIKNPKDKYQLIIDEPAAEIVKKIFSMYAEGKGYHLICKYLNENKIPSPTEYKKMQGSNFVCANNPIYQKIEYEVEENDTLERIAYNLHSDIEDIKQYNHLTTDELEVGQIIIVPTKGYWTRDTIARMLQNETYIGTLVQGRMQRESYKDHRIVQIPKDEWIKVPHCHNAIIDKETWEIVKKRTENNLRYRPSKDGEVHLFSQKVYCACCGKVFQRNLCHVKGGKQAYMHCKKRQVSGQSVCDNKGSIRYDYLENYILEQINEQIEKYYNLSKIEANYYSQKIENQTESQLKNLEDEKKKLKQQISKKENSLSVLYEDRVNGIIDVSEFSLIKNQYTVDINSFNQRIDIINNEISELQNKKTIQVNKEALFKKYKKLDSLNRIVLDEFIDRIYIDKVNPETKSRKIKINWNLCLD